MGRKRDSSKKKSGGSLMGLRSGLRSAAGSGKKRRRKGKEEASFAKVFMYLSAASVAVFILWRLSLP